MANTNDWLNFEHLTDNTVREELKPPSMYKVILNNDDYTPMEFVIDVLQKFFSYDIERATELMLKVHYDGKAICGVFTAEVAETKLSESISMPEKMNILYSALWKNLIKPPYL